MKRSTKFDLVLAGLWVLSVVGCILFVRIIISLLAQV